jgi:hypothetical protein
MKILLCFFATMFCFTLAASSQNATSSHLRAMRTKVVTTTQIVCPAGVAMSSLGTCCQPGEITVSDMDNRFRSCCAPGTTTVDYNGKCCAVGETLVGGRYGICCPVGVLVYDADSKCCGVGDVRVGNNCCSRSDPCFPDYWKM